MVQVGDQFPKGVKFTYVPYQEDAAGMTVCGIPITYDCDKELPNKTVVLVGYPGAFTKGCSENHLPPFVEKINELKAKGVDDVLALAANDPFVQSAFGKALGVKGEIQFVTDTYAEFSDSIGFGKDLTDKGMGKRAARYAMIVDHGKITYMEKEPAMEITVSGVDAVLAKL